MRPRIAIVLSQLRGAGIQRMRLNIAARLVECGYAVDLVVGKSAGQLSRDVPAGVPVYTVAEGGRYTFFFGLLRYLAKHRPSHVMSSYEDISVMLILSNWILCSRSTVLISTHNALSRLSSENGRLYSLKFKALALLMRLLYRKAASLVAVSEGVADDLSKIVAIPRENIEVIYNPVINSHFDSKMSEAAPKELEDVSEETLIGYFGRFHPQKSVDTLIRAFSIVSRNRASKLLLIGEGDEKHNLQLLAEELGVASDVIFFGYASNPFPIMKLCDVIVLPSAYEGLGNVLIEALACGIQVVSTDCSFGPAEILEYGKWGQLVPVGDEVAMGEAIRKSLDGEFWVEPSRLEERGWQFSAIKATEKYLDELGLPRLCRK